MEKETKDTKQLKEYIKKQIQKLKDEEIFGFDTLLELMRKSANTEIIKECVEKGNCFDIPDSDILIPVLIEETKNIDFIKECINNGEKYNIPHSGLMQLIENTKDIEYIKQCIDNFEKFKMNDADLVKLIECIDDEEYNKECIENYEKFHLGGYNIVELAKSIHDDEFLKKCIQMHEELDLNSNSVRYLLSEMSDTNIREYIFKHNEIGLDSTDAVKIIKNTGDKDFIKQCIEQNKKLELGGYDVYLLIKSLNNEKVLKECVANYKDYGLNKDDIKRLIIITNDIQYITDTLLKNREELKINDSDILETIANVERYNEISIPDSQKQEILNRLEYVKESTRQINIPEEMTIGVEIESEGNKSRTIEAEDGWEKKTDNSLQYGIEVTSPILTGDNDMTTNEIRKMCAKLQQAGQYTSERCGGHVHIGADYLDSERAWENFIEIWGNTEEIIYAISNEEGQAPRRPIIQYAKPISKKFEKNIEKDSVTLETEEDLKAFIVNLQNQDRFYAVNFQNLYIGNTVKNDVHFIYTDQMEFLDNVVESPPPVINTIEFRLSNGSIVADTWVDNINLFAGIVKSSKDLALIQEKEDKDVTEEEKKKIKLFERIKENDIEEEQKMKDLLQLVVEGSQDIYLRRYEENSKLIKEDKEVNDAIKNNITSSPIDLKKIGKKVFIGEDAITAQEYQGYCDFLQRQNEERMI